MAFKYKSVVFAYQEKFSSPATHLNLVVYKFYYELKRLIMKSFGYLKSKLGLITRDNFRVPVISDPALTSTIIKFW